MCGKYLMTLFIVLSAALLAQQETLIPEYERVYREATQAYQSKEYSKAIQLYHATFAYPDGEKRQLEVFYNIACCYSLTGNADSALAYLRKTIEGGYFDYRWIKRDADFERLRRRNAVRFDSLVTLAVRQEQKEVITKSPIAVLEYDTYTGSTDISKFRWDDYKHPKTDSLRRRYQLPKVIEKGKTELEKFLLLLDWVATRWKHQGDNMAKERNALAILEAAEKGERFCCANYADVLVNCFSALGYPARFVGLSRYGVAIGSGKGHGGVEVWSNELQKWIFLDGQNDAWWEANGTILNADECRRYVLDGKEDSLKFVGQHKDFDYAAITPEWIVYFYHITLGFNNTFYDTVKTGDGTYFEMFTDKVTPELYFQNFPMNMNFSTDHALAYPLLNQTKIRLKHSNPSTPSDTLDVLLSHTMPFFDHYLVRFDKGEWKESTDSIRWVLIQGDNTFEAKAVNVAGIEGRGSMVVVKNNVPELKP